MKKLIIIFLLMYTLPVIGQNESKNQSIELPDFVITGVQSITIPEMEKKIPGVMQSLSSEFFKPRLQPEQLSLAGFVNPLRKDFNILNNGNYNNGLLILGAGVYTLPTGDFYFNGGAENFLFDSHVWGENTTEYIDNAGYNQSGAKLATTFFLNTDSRFLPGLKLSVSGLFNRDSYKLYGSNSPTYKRENEYVDGNISIEDKLSTKVKFGFSAAYNSVAFKDVKFNENIIDLNGYMNLIFGNMGFNLNGSIVRQNVYDDKVLDNIYNYVSGEAKLTLKPMESMNVAAGVFYSKQDTNTFFAPVISANIKLDRNLSLFLEYFPRTEFVNLKKLLQQNRFISIGSFYNTTMERTSSFNLTLKYEFEKYFEINLNTEYSKADNFTYFTDANQPGVFDISSLNNVTDFKSCLSLLFHKGPMGYFYSDIRLSYVKDKPGNYVPYNSLLKAKATYGFPFGKMFDLSTSLNYYGERYADVQNQKKLDSFIDLSVKVAYNIFGDMTLTFYANNLLNRKQFIFERYQEKPLDLVAGIEYRW